MASAWGGGNRPPAARASSSSGHIITSADLYRAAGFGFSNSHDDSGDLREMMAEMSVVKVIPFTIWRYITLSWSIWSLVGGAWYARGLVFDGLRGPVVSCGAWVCQSICSSEYGIHDLEDFASRSSSEHLACPQKVRSRDQYDNPSQTSYLSFAPH
jgi:hypothetical protein